MELKAVPTRLARHEEKKRKNKINGTNPPILKVSGCILRIITLHGTILSTLSISSHGFSLGFPKMPQMEMYSFTHKLMIIL